MPSVGQLLCGVQTCLMPDHDERSTSDTMSTRHHDSGGRNSLGGDT
jgi:hypothetical protein